MSTVNIVKGTPAGPRSRSVPETLFTFQKDTRNLEDALGTEPESYITEYTLVYEDKELGVRVENAARAQALLQASEVDL